MLRVIADPLSDTTIAPASLGGTVAAVEAAMAEERSARLLRQVAIAMVQLHHTRVRQLGAEVKQSVLALGAEKDGVAWRPVVAAYDALAKQLGHHLHEFEEMVVDRIQVLWAQQKLRFGALARSAGTVKELRDESAQLQPLLDELYRALGSPALDRNSWQHVAMQRFAQACVERVAFEADALAPLLEPFVSLT